MTILRNSLRLIHTGFSFPATVLIFLTVLWVKAIYPASSGLADTDFYWHLATGQWILEHGTLPATDQFSWTMAGTPYRITQWLGETVLAAAYNLGGLYGTKVLSVLLTAFTIGFAWMAARRYVHTSVALGIAITCNLVTVVTPMRPQLFTFAMVSLLAWIAAEWMTTGRRWLIYFIPPIMALWVNLHGGYVVGVGFLGLLCVGLWYEAHAQNVPRTPELWHLTLVCCLGGIATLANPYGIGAWESILMISGLRSSSVIAEWLPVNLTTELGWLYLLNLVPFIGLIAAGARPRPVHALLGGFFLLFGYLANRQVAICAAVMAPLVASLLAQTPQYRAMAAGVSNTSRPLHHLIILAALLASLPWVQARGDARWQETINGRYPVNATAFLKAHGLTARVFSDTLEASYLIYAGIPVFIDGRMDLYRDRFFFEYHLASKGAPGWNELLAKYRPATLLLRNDVALRQLALAGGNWKLIYEDDQYSVLRPTTDPSHLPLTPRHLEYLDEQGSMIRSYMP